MFRVSGRSAEIIGGVHSNTTSPLFGGVSYYVIDSGMVGYWDVRASRGSVHFLWISASSRIVYYDASESL